METVIRKNKLFSFSYDTLNRTGLFLPIVGYNKEQHKCWINTENFHILSNFRLDQYIIYRMHNIGDNKYLRIPPHQKRTFYTTIVEGKKYCSMK